jgi:hypothetical protein
MVARLGAAGSGDEACFVTNWLNVIFLSASQISEIYIEIACALFRTDNNSNYLEFEVVRNRFEMNSFTLPGMSVKKRLVKKIKNHFTPAINLFPAS